MDIASSTNHFLSDKNLLLLYQTICLLFFAVMDKSLSNHNKLSALQSNASSSSAYEEDMPENIWRLDREHLAMTNLASVPTGKVM